MSQTLYGRDFVQWAEQQADLLRSGCFDQLDAANVAEEIESLAKRDKRELRSRSAEIVEHLLKLRLSPKDLAWRQENERQWRISIVKHRIAIDQLLEDSPSPKSSLTKELLEKCYADGAKQFAATEFERWAKAPKRSIFTWKEILERE